MDQIIKSYLIGKERLATKAAGAAIDNTQTLEDALSKIEFLITEVPTACEMLECAREIIIDKMSGSSKYIARNSSYKVIVFEEISSSACISSSAEAVLSLYPYFESKVSKLGESEYKHVYYALETDHIEYKEAMNSIHEFIRSQKDGSPASLLIRRILNMQ